MPTASPFVFSPRAISRTVVVFPLVPVTETMGTDAVRPTGNSMSRMSFATFTGAPSEGVMCIRSPGPALTSRIAPPFSSNGTEISFEQMSMPATSSPIASAARTAYSAFFSWTASIARAVPPLDRLAFFRSTMWVPSAGTEEGESPASRNRCTADSSSSIFVSGFSCPSPRFGFRFSISTSERMVLTPSPITSGGLRSAAAETLPPTTSNR